MRFPLLGGRLGGFVTGCAYIYIGVEYVERCVSGLNTQQLNCSSARGETFEVVLEHRPVPVSACLFVLVY